MESSSVKATSESTQNVSDSDPTSGCGCNVACKTTASNITISVTPTTGGQFDLAVTKSDTIENLKKLISKKLKVPKERICLLHRERQLREGTVQDNQLVDGSRLTLLPSVETGLLAQRPEQSVMQALESLNDSQVNDFLSGKSPLNLTMRLGDHVMLIQLQLSTVTPSAGVKRKGASSKDPLASLTSIVNKSLHETVVTPPPESKQCKCEPKPPVAAPSTPAPTAAANATTAAAAAKPQLDTHALAEASRNLTQTLKQLSSEVLTTKGDSVEDVPSAKRCQGAIIESMHHHGKGVYSGTFSGTLNPALQDRFGRPKRDISTIIHILNDLLCATPQYRSSRGGAHETKPPTEPTTDGGEESNGGSGSVVPTARTTAVGSSGGGESSENAATRGKMERLRLILEERRERRRAARSNPYPRHARTQWSAKSTTGGAAPPPPDPAPVAPEPVIA